MAAPEIEVLVFARVAEVVGRDRVRLPRPATAGELKTAIAAAYCELQPLAASLLVAVDGGYVADGYRLSAVDREVAVFPPVSGG